MVVFEERGNRSTWRKPLGAEWRTNKLNPHLMQIDSTRVTAVVFMTSTVIFSFV